jgi:putative nucleotidyltransferase-like protein
VPGAGNRALDACDVHASLTMSASPATSPDALIAALLRGDAADLDLLTAQGVDRIRETALAHDVLPLVADRLASDLRLPSDFRARFLADVHAAAAHDLSAEAELRSVLAEFQRLQIPTLVVKGSHLAYTHYARPELRSRTDTDLLISRPARDAADAVLTGALGYVAESKVSGDFTATQMLYVKRAGDRVVQMIDLHWRLASPQLFAHVLSFDDLYAASVPLPLLGIGGRGPSNVHALVIACMHRVAHHQDEADQFKWLLDIHLMASRLDESEWQAFSTHVAERQIAAVCLDCLERTAEWFDTALPAWLRGDARLIGAQEREPTAAYLVDRSKAAVVLDDLRALRSWRARWRLMSEHLFPGAEYMRTIYAPSSRAPLAWLYTARFVAGAAVWLRVSNHRSQPPKGS